MRRLVGAALAACCCLASAGAAPAYAYRLAHADTALAVPANGLPVATPVATSAGVTYEINVEGTFAYDAFGGLADCRNHDTNATVLRQEWEPGGARLQLDGADAPCGFGSGTHTYTFLVPGTGAPFAFRIEDPTGYADNAGGLAVTVTARWGVDATCELTAVSQPGSNVMTVAIVTEAHQTGVSPAYALTTTYVGCDLLRDGVVVDGAGASSAGVTTGPAYSTVTVPAGVFTTCVYASVFEAFHGTRAEYSFCT